MFEVAKEDERSLRNIEPSPLTKELAQRFHTDAQLLPPGCPPGGTLGPFDVCLAMQLLLLLVSVLAG